VELNNVWADPYSTISHISLSSLCNSKERLVLCRAQEFCSSKKIAQL